MEENLDKNNEINQEISDNTTKSNSEEIKGPKSEKVINMDINNCDSATKVVSKNEINTPEKPITCLLYTSPSPRDLYRSRMPSSA